MPEELTGLRERKKLATRAALGQAAWQLTIQRGYAHTRVEDIAAAAGVAARTFSNYFSSKEEALLTVGEDRGARMVSALRGRPDGESLWEALADAVSEQFAGSGEVPQADARSIAFHRNSPLRSGWPPRPWRSPRPGHTPRREMRRSPVDADAVIAEAGPTGLMLACELHLAGVRPIVLERLAVSPQGCPMRLRSPGGLWTPSTTAAHSGASRPAPPRRRTPRTSP